MTVNERVHQYLAASAAATEAPFRTTGVNGWVCGLWLAKPDIGGLRVAARIHDLRSQGVLIESKSCDCWNCDRRRNMAKRRGQRFAPVAAYRLVGEGVAAA